MMNHICATFLVLCQIHITDLQDHQTQFVNQITKCAIEYNSMVEAPNRLPVFLVIAQSAFESDWGRSRFAIEGNNYFGIREYTETNQVKFENGQLTILEDDKEKLLTIMWELAEYSPQIASQMLGGK